MKLAPSSMVVWLMAFGGAATLPAQITAQSTGGISQRESATAEALFQQEFAGDTEAAIQSYWRVIGEYDRQRPEVAQAIFRLAEIYRSQGRAEEAKAQYARILREFPDQVELTRMAHRHLYAPEESREQNDRYGSMTPERDRRFGLLPADSKAAPAPQPETPRLAQLEAAMLRWLEFTAGLLMAQEFLPQQIDSLEATEDTPDTPFDARQTWIVYFQQAPRPGDIRSPHSVLLVIPHPAGGETGYTVMANNAYATIPDYRYELRRAFRQMKETYPGARLSMIHGKAAPAHFLMAVFEAALEEGHIISRGPSTFPDSPSVSIFPGARLEGQEKLDKTFIFNWLKRLGLAVRLAMEQTGFQNAFESTPGPDGQWMMPMAVADLLDAPPPAVAAVLQIAWPPGSFQLLPQSEIPLFLAFSASEADKGTMLFADGSVWLWSGWKEKAFGPQLEQLASSAANADTPAELRLTLTTGQKVPLRALRHVVSLLEAQKEEIRMRIDTELSNQRLMRLMIERDPGSEK